MLGGLREDRDELIELGSARASAEPGAAVDDDPRAAEFLGDGDTAIESLEERPVILGRNEELCARFDELSGQLDAGLLERGLERGAPLSPSPPVGPHISTASNPAAAAARTRAG